RGEVAVLVEDAVVREEAFAVDRLDLARGADRARVVEVAVEVGRADEGGDASGRAGDLLERALRGADEPRPEQQVLGRVAGDGELGKEDEVGVGLPGLFEPGQNPVAVSVEGASGGDDLAERESHGCSLGFRLSVETVASG